MNSTRGGPSALGHRIAARLADLTVNKVREPGFRNAEANAARIAEGRSILAMRESRLMQGDAALIVAAGPSLHRRDVADRIQRSGFRGTIIATESAVAYCLRNGIVPDLMVTLDPHPDRIVRWLGDRTLTAEKLQEDDYFRRQDLEPHFGEDELARNLDLISLVDRHGRAICAAVSSSASPAVVDRIHQAGMVAYWWNPFYDDYELDDSLTRKIHVMNGLPCLNAGGNVGSAAWVIAHAVLEKKQIGLVGMDFGYYADTPYEKTQYYREIVDLVGADRLDEVYVRIENPHLKATFYTDPAYLWYRDSFLEMAQRADCRTLNCTEGGILFGEGVAFAPLEEFLASNRMTPDQGAGGRWKDG